jgi:hypothetical protein
MNHFKRRSIMKKLFAIFLMVFATLWLTSGFAAPPEETVYRFLNPQGIPGPVEVQGLAPRLDTIVGKTIYVVVCEAGPQTGPFLEQYLKGKYPETTWIRIQHNGFGPTDPATDGKVLEEADAVIGGQSW